MAERMGNEDYARASKAMQDGVDLYQKALALETNNAECFLRAYRGLVPAYHKMEQMTGLRQLKLYYFDLEMECIDQILYYSPENSGESLAFV